MSEKPVTILHIEDDQVDKMVIDRVIKRLNITSQLLHAPNGEEALDILRGTNGKTKADPMPNVILLDINMPKMNGLEFLKELRADESIKSISVFVLTTSNDDADRKEAYDHNVAGYILKPVDIAQFETTFQVLANFWKICEWP
ncbi:MAG: response regulator [Bacteroidetes bacterium]|nr:response regulator [Bacteroidota bacterium]